MTRFSKTSQPVPEITFNPALMKRVLDPFTLAESLAATQNMSAELAPETATVTRTLFSRRRHVVFHALLANDRQSVRKPYLAELSGDSSAEHCARERRKLAKSRRAQLEKTDDQSVFEVPELGLVFRRAGLDAKLPGLRLLHDRRRAAEVCARALGISTKRIAVHTSLMAHRLGKRAVIRADISGSFAGRLYLRIRPISSSSGLEAFKRHQRVSACLAADKTVFVPKAHCYDAEYGAAVYGNIPGHQLDFRPSKTNAHTLAAARALNAIFRHGPRSETIYTGSDELSLIRDWSERLSRLCPDLRDSIARAVDKVEPGLATDTEFAPCHRDFHEGQLLVGSNHVGILDFDTFRLADPALDAGNLMAHLRLRSIKTGVSLSQSERVIGSDALKRVPEARLRLWIDAALLRLAGIWGFTSNGRPLARALLREIGT